MLRISRQAILLVLLSGALSGTDAQEKNMPQVSSGQIPSLEIINTQRFVGKGLYGYIDGGADLYHEFGFDRLVVQDIRFNSEPYSVEVFRMSDPPAALGIFSVSRGNCGRADSLARFSCCSSYAVQWALSKYFLRIANSSGFPAAQAGGLQLARLLSKQIQGDSIQVPSLLAVAGGSERGLLFVRGFLGMQNGLDEWSPLVDGLDGFEAYLVVRQDPTLQAIVGDFRFKEPADLKKFMIAFSREKKLRHSQQKGDRRVIVMESDAPADSLWSRIVRLP